jgi:hypothetical protein
VLLVLLFGQKRPQKGTRFFIGGQTAALFEVFIRILNACALANHGSSMVNVATLQQTAAEF